MIVIIVVLVIVEPLRGSTIFLYHKCDHMTIIGAFDTNIQIFREDE